jgi:hypothetical protein
VCGGTGQITGPKSLAYHWSPGDPFNRVVRRCDECEGTGVVTKLREAAMRALAMQKVLPIIEWLFGEEQFDDAALLAWENEGGFCV